MYITYDYVRPNGNFLIFAKNFTHPRSIRVKTSRPNQGACDCRDKECYPATLVEYVVT